MKNPKQLDLFDLEPISEIASRVVGNLGRRLASNGRPHSQQYRYHMQSSRWRETRRRMVGQAQHRCERCGRPSNYLELHHVTYFRLGDERDEDLQVLCKPCHNEADEERQEAMAMMWDS